MLKSSLEKKLLKRIKRYNEEGFNKTQIKLALIKQDYPSDVIKDLIQKAEKNEKKDRKIKPEKIPIDAGKVFITLGLIIVIALIIFVSYKAIDGNYKTCESESCFITAANACKSAAFTSIKAGAVFTFKTKNCVLTKEAVTLAIDDLAEIQELIEGTSMRCKYQKGSFDERLVTTITQGVASCEGSLKENLEIIRDILLDV